MGLRDRFGRLLSRLRGTAAGNRYASVVKQKIEQVKRQQELGGFLQQRIAETRQKQKTGYRPFQGPAELSEADVTAEQLGIEIPLNEQQQEAALGWQSVSSSNVEAIRWVGGNWGTQVRFLAKKNSPASEYEYFGGFADFQELKNASSKGQTIWAWRRAGKPYHRISGGRGKETLMYPWGQVAKGDRKRPDLEIPTREREWWQREGKTEKWYRQHYQNKGST